MKRWLADMNSTLRGFLIIIGVVLLVIVLNQQTTLLSLVLLTRIAFFLAIAFFVYLMWRERRGDISSWPGRAQFAFYGGALLILVAIGAFVVTGVSGRSALAFFVILGLCGFSMFRVWRDQHTYG
jgi:small-conductance mechanosensitive channel